MGFSGFFRRRRPPRAFVGWAGIGQGSRRPCRSIHDPDGPGWFTSPLGRKPGRACCSTLLWRGRIERLRGGPLNLTWPGTWDSSRKTPSWGLSASEKVLTLVDIFSFLRVPMLATFVRDGFGRPDSTGIWLSVFALPTGITKLVSNTGSLVPPAASGTTIWFCMVWYSNFEKALVRRERLWTVTPQRSISRPGADIRGAAQECGRRVRRGPRCGGEIAPATRGRADMRRRRCRGSLRSVTTASRAIGDENEPKPGLVNSEPTAARLPPSARLNHA